MVELQVASDAIIVWGFIAIGCWLQGVGKITDVFDRILQPLQLGISGLAVVAVRLMMS